MVSFPLSCHCCRVRTVTGAGVVRSLRRTREPVTVICSSIGLVPGASSPFVLVQLLRFTEGGRDKYLQYSATAQPILRILGAQVLYAGECVEPFVPGEGKPWDAIVVVRYPSRSAYVQLLGDPGFKAIADL